MQSTSHGPFFEGGIIKSLCLPFLQAPLHTDSPNCFFLPGSSVVCVQDLINAGYEEGVRRTKSLTSRISPIFIICGQSRGLQPISCQSRNILKRKHFRENLNSTLSASLHLKAEIGFIYSVPLKTGVGVGRQLRTICKYSAKPGVANPRPNEVEFTLQPRNGRHSSWGMDLKQNLCPLDQLATRLSPHPFLPPLS